MTTRPVSIAVVGSGYVGLVASVCFAEIGHSVICVDNDEQKVAMLRNGGVPIHEDFLPELLARHRNQGLQFTTDLSSATQHAEAIFIAVGTPQSDSGNADLSYVDAVATQIARSIGNYKVIVEKSTVPVYTNEWIRRVVERNGTSSSNFDVASNPEFLARRHRRYRLPPSRSRRRGCRQRSGCQRAESHLRAAHKRRVLPQR